MKKYLTPFNILVIFVILLIFFEAFPFGIKNYKINDKIIQIPRLSIIEKKNKNELILISFRDSSSLKSNIKNILKKYQIVKTNNKSYYYDIKQNMTIKKYELKKGFLMNKIIIKYE